MGIGKKWEGGGGFWCVGIGEKWRWILGCGNRGKRGRVEVDFGVWERGRGRNRTHDLRSEARNEPTRLKVCAHRLNLYKPTRAGEESNPRPSLRSQERSNSAESRCAQAQCVQTDWGGRRNRTHDLRPEARNEPTRLKVCAHEPTTFASEADSQDGSRAARHNPEMVANWS